MYPGVKGVPTVRRVFPVAKRAFLLPVAKSAFLLPVAKRAFLLPVAKSVQHRCTLLRRVFNTGAPC